MSDALALLDNTPAEPPIGEYRQGTTTFHSQLIAEFPNGYGASVVRGPYTYGGPEGYFELAVLHYDPTDDGGDRWPLCYQSGITDDVIGWLTPEQVVAKLHEIARLERRSLCDHRMRWFDTDDEEDA